jgi:hypothetical protein
MSLAASAAAVTPVTFAAVATSSLRCWEAGKRSRFAATVGSGRIPTANLLSRGECHRVHLATQRLRRPC